MQGDFGKSWYTDTPAFRLVLERMPPTLYLTTAGLVCALLGGIALGDGAVALGVVLIVIGLVTAFGVGWLLVQRGRRA